jgi:chromosome segregation ATPase
VAAPDDGLANLQRFIAHLIAATGGLEASLERFKEAGQQLATLEDESAVEGDGLNQQLTEMTTAVEAGVDAAGDALGAVERAAADGQETASRARHQIEAAASEAEEDTERTLLELADAHANLLAQGFAALGQRLDASEQELEAEAQRLEQAFTGLEASLAEQRSEGVAAWEGAEGELDDSIGQLTQAGSAVGSAAGEGIQGFAAAQDEFEQRCSDLAGDVDLMYDRLDAAVAEQGHDWEQHLAGLTKEALGFVESGAQEQLEQPAGLVEDEALQALEGELGALEAVLDAGADAVGPLHSLAEELARCQSVVVQIAELMNALAG